MDLKSCIRDIPDWPKPGITFKDITPLLKDSVAFAYAVESMADPYRDDEIEMVVGVESRGFILGAPVARALGTGFVPVRKMGKLPHECRTIEYQLEYGTDHLAIHTDAIRPNQRVLVVDDVLATGGTLRACCDLVEGLGGRVFGPVVLIELTFLNGRQKLGHRQQPLHSVLSY